MSNKEAETTLRDRALLALGVAAVPLATATAGVEQTTITYDTVDFAEIQASGDNVETLGTWAATPVNNDEGMKLSGGFERLTPDDMSLGFAEFLAGGEASGRVDVGTTIPLAWDFDVLWETSARIPDGRSAADVLSWSITANVNVFDELTETFQTITTKVEGTDPNNFTSLPTNYSGSQDLVSSYVGEVRGWSINFNLSWFDQQFGTLLTVDVPGNSIDLGNIPAPGTGLALLGFAGIAARRRR